MQLPVRCVGSETRTRVIEDEGFARQMEEMDLQDLSNATEIVLDLKRKVWAPGEPRHPAAVATSGGGSVGRVAAGALRIGNAVGAAFTNRRVLEPVEARILLTSGAVLAGLSALSALFPAVPAYTLVVLLAWISLALLYGRYRLYRKGKKAETDISDKTP